jgi:hypothetical protein
MNLRLGCAALLCSVPWVAIADPEHDRIASERKAAEAKFAAQQRECATRFVVSSCVEDAQNERRATLNRLRQDQIQLDEAKRSEAAAARRQSLRTRAESQQTRASEPPPPPLRTRTRHASAADLPASGVLPAPQRPPAARPSAAERQAAEQESEAKFESRARAAQAHRDDVERRNAQRKAQGKIAAPLPPPAGASSPN